MDLHCRVKSKSFVASLVLSFLIFPGSLRIKVSRRSYLAGEIPTVECATIYYTGSKPPPIDSSLLISSRGWYLIHLWHFYISSLHVPCPPLNGSEPLIFLCGDNSDHSPSFEEISDPAHPDLADEYRLLIFFCGSDPGHSHGYSILQRFLPRFHNDLSNLAMDEDCEGLQHWMGIASKGFGWKDWGFR